MFIYPVEDYYDCNNECISDLDGDGICDEVDTASCNDESAENYDPFTTEIDNTLCIYPTGCTDVEAANYNPEANTRRWFILCLSNFRLYRPRAIWNMTLFNTNDSMQCVNLLIEGCMNQMLVITIL